MRGRVLVASVVACVVAATGLPPALAAHRLEAAPALSFLHPFTSSKEGNAATFDATVAGALRVRICDVHKGTCATITSTASSAGVIETRSRAHVVRWDAPLALLTRPYTITVSLKATAAAPGIDLGTRRFYLAPPVVGWIIAPEPTVPSSGIGTVPFYLHVARHPVVRARQLALNGTAPAAAAAQLRAEFALPLSTVADVLTTGYGLAPAVVLRALLDGTGAPAADAAAALRDGLHLDAASIAAALVAAGVPLAPATLALRAGLGLDAATTAGLVVDAFGLTAADADALAAALAGAGATFAEVAAALRAELGLGDAAVVAALKAAGAAMGDAAAAMAALGVAPQQVARLVHDAYGASLGDVAVVLAALGQTATQIAQILLAEFGATPPTAAAALVAAGADASSVVAALAASYGACDPACLVGALKAAGYTAAQIGAALRAQQPGADRVEVILAFDAAGFAPADVYDGLVGFAPEVADDAIDRALEAAAALFRAAGFDATKTARALLGSDELEPLASVDTQHLLVRALGFFGDVERLYTAVEAAEAFRNLGLSAYQFGTANLTDGGFQADVYLMWEMSTALRQVFGSTAYEVTRILVLNGRHPFTIVDVITDTFPLTEQTIPAVARDLARAMKDSFTARAIADALHTRFAYKVVAAGLDDLGFDFHQMIVAMDGVLRTRTQEEVDLYALTIKNANNLSEEVAYEFAETFWRPQAMARLGAVAMHYALTTRPSATIDSGGISFIPVRLAAMAQIPRIMRNTFGMPALFIARVFDHRLGHTPAQVVRRLQEAGFTSSEIDDVVVTMYGDQSDPEDDEQSHADAGSLIDFGDVGIDTVGTGTCVDGSQDPAQIDVCVPF